MDTEGAFNLTYFNNALVKDVGVSYTLSSRLRATLEGRLIRLCVADVQALPKGRCAITTPTVPCCRSSLEGVYILRVISMIFACWQRGNSRTVLELIRRGLCTVVVWCDDDDLLVNPDKTYHVILTRKRNSQVSLNPNFLDLPCNVLCQPNTLW
jgi:hypothetical protein